jgi:dolichol-phosphate mannosyltransferase
MQTETAGAALNAGRTDRIGSVSGHGIPEESRASPRVADDCDGGPLVSIVAPVYCEEQVLGEFYGRCKQALQALGGAIRHEVIFVNDGSTDGSLAVLLDIARRDPAVRVIELSRNFGHQVAITAGIDHAAGDAVIVLDADLQDPPEVIGEMVGLWREGNQVVYGVRRARRGESAFKRLTAGAFYRILARLSDVRVPLDSGDFRLMDRAVIDVLKELREESRYIRGLVSWVGFRQCPLPYDRDPRFAGKTKFGLSRMFIFAFDGISSFSDKPLRIASHLGMLVTVGALLGMVWVIAGKLIDPTTSIAGWASVMVAVLFLGGVQLLSIGLLGEYVGRIFRQAKARPLYVVARRVNFAHRAGASERNTKSLSSANESTAQGGATTIPAR